MTIKVASFPIWIFWYKPSTEVINSANNYLNKNARNYFLGIIFYLQISPDITKSFAEEEHKLDAELNTEIVVEPGKTLLYQIPNPLDLQNFTAITDLLARIIKPLAEEMR